MPSVNEIPGKAPSLARQRANGLNRRQALSLLATGIAGSLAACSKPDEQIVPYVQMPERLVPGEPLKFATTLTLSGFGRGVIVTSIDGRPIKIEGNPRHPASLGATDVFAEATVLSLYDPDRSRTVLHNGEIASLSPFRQALLQQQRLIKPTGGAGFRLLTSRTTSPTLMRQIDDLLQVMPQAKWHAYDPLDNDGARAGAEMAFGRPLYALAKFEKARVIVSLDADPLGHGPDQMRNARGFAVHRSLQPETISRIYAVESTPTLTGAKADHRLALHPQEIDELAIALAHALGASIREAVVSDKTRSFLRATIEDLNGNRGAAVILPGAGLSAESHALVHWINAQIAAPVDVLPSLIATPSEHQPSSLKALSDDLESGTVEQLVMIGVNPAYDAPADLDFAARARKAKFSIHAGCYADESADVATWHVPLSHVLESWSDARASDGTASLVQPLIRPLYRTVTDHELMTMLAGTDETSAYDLVRETWRAQASGNFDDWWAHALEDGTIATTASSPAKVAPPKLPAIPPVRSKPEAFTIVLRPDPSVWDGSFANNAWLQECPKPLTKQVWGNALLLHPEDASHLGVTSGDIVKISADGQSHTLPALSEPAMPIGVASLTLGYGRSRAGAIGNTIGANGYALRTSQSPWTIARAEITRTGRRQDILTTQNIVRSPEDVRELYPVRVATDVSADKPQQPSAKPDLLPGRPRPPADHAWAMVIDTSLCIGCNACVVACQSENNVPVVGPEEVARGRDMHWLRVDVYDSGTPSDPQLGFQPVPCMHCEHAPCEPVCPVAASVHDGEGLNVQVYNRCVGTRFCEANCPYKVRRFNFFGYADGQEYANLGLESYRGQRNPEVTVRARGVMEKCTYCVQRISGARRGAERDGRPIGADEVRTACQSACPTQAITFGDLNNKEATVNTRKADPRHYALLEHLNTKPRTTYLADIRNPAPGFKEDPV